MLRNPDETIVDNDSGICVPKWDPIEKFIIGRLDGSTEYLVLRVPDYLNEDSRHGSRLFSYFEIAKKIYSQDQPISDGRLRSP